MSQLQYLQNKIRSTNFFSKSEPLTILKQQGPHDLLEVSIKYIALAQKDKDIVIGSLLWVIRFRVFCFALSSNVRLKSGFNTAGFIIHKANVSWFCPLG